MRTVFDLDGRISVRISKFDFLVRFPGDAGAQQTHVFRRMQRTAQVSQSYRICAKKRTLNHERDNNQAKSMKKIQ